VRLGYDDDQVASLAQRGIVTVARDGT
jgi:hypothetical protein